MCCPFCYLTHINEWPVESCNKTFMPRQSAARGYLKGLIMIRLASVLFSIIATTLSGSLIVTALVAGYDTLIPIVTGAGVGAVLAIPVSVFVARAIMANGTSA